MKDPTAECSESRDIITSMEQAEKIKEAKRFLNYLIERHNLPEGYEITLQLVSGPHVPNGRAAQEKGV